MIDTRRPQRKKTTHSAQGNPRKLLLKLDDMLSESVSKAQPPVMSALETRHHSAKGMELEARCWEKQLAKAQFRLGNFLSYQLLAAGTPAAPAD